MSSPLQQGRIIWVELRDPQGRNPKRRPAVILTSTSEIRDDGEVVIAALSSQIDQSPPEVSVEVPWHRNGHPRTKLNRRNVVVCNWLTTLSVAAIRPEDIGGSVPFGPMARILEIVRAHETATQNEPVPDPEDSPLTEFDGIGVHNSVVGVFEVANFRRLLAHWGIGLILIDSSRIFAELGSIWVGMESKCS